MQKQPLKILISNWLDDTLSYLFPIASQPSLPKQPDTVQQLLDTLQHIAKLKVPALQVRPAQLNTVEQALPVLRKQLLKDAIATLKSDPSAQSLDEIIICYPGFYATFAYRLAHLLDTIGFTLIPRIISEHAHSKTGIDIHPKAVIGESFSIDHGTGIVIGETTTIGKFVKIYQGVTLGALSVSRKQKGKKRHPSIEDHCTLYAGSTILGGTTIIGHHSVIGGKVWLTKSVEAYSVVSNKAEIQLDHQKRKRNLKYNSNEAKQHS